MDNHLPATAIVAVVFLAVLSAVVWHMFSGEVVGRMDVGRRSPLGLHGRMRLTVRRVGGDRAATARLQASGAFGYRGIDLSKSEAARCVELLSRCAKDGRVAEGAAGAKAGDLEIAPDLDHQGTRAVALVFPGDSETIDLRLLLTPSQAETAASWVRIAVAPGATLLQARRNSRIAK
jgi:hypothetical protein